MKGEIKTCHADCDQMLVVVQLYSASALEMIAKVFAGWANSATKIFWNQNKIALLQAKITNLMALILQMQP